MEKIAFVKKIAVKKAPEIETLNIQGYEYKSQIE
jgi:hypothetical protein